MTESSDDSGAGGADPSAAPRRRSRRRGGRGRSGASRAKKKGDPNEAQEALLTPSLLNAAANSGASSSASSPVAAASAPAPAPAPAPSPSLSPNVPSVAAAVSSPSSLHPTVKISQTVAILIDGNNIERSIQNEAGEEASMLNIDLLIPRLLANRALNRLIYFREGKAISSKLADRLHSLYHGSVQPCHKSADIPLSIKATQLAKKVDTIIIMSGDSDYVELVNHLKSEGVRVEIAAIESSTAKVLIDEADYFHPITREYWFHYTPSKRR